VPSLGVTVPFRCVECRTEFLPAGGGHCERCGRLLCSTHLFGVVIGYGEQINERVCVRCREQASGELPSGKKQ
jgi:hypothetical protein